MCVENFKSNKIILCSDTFKYQKTLVLVHNLSEKYQFHKLIYFTRDFIVPLVYEYAYDTKQEIQQIYQSKSDVTKMVM